MRRATDEEPSASELERRRRFYGQVMELHAMQLEGSSQFSRGEKMLHEDRNR